MKNLTTSHASCSNFGMTSSAARLGFDTKTRPEIRDSRTGEFLAGFSGSARKGWTLRAGTDAARVEFGTETIADADLGTLAARIS